MSSSSYRWVIVAAGGWACLYLLHTSANGYFVIVAGSLAVYAITIAVAIWLGRWKK